MKLTLFDLDNTLLPIDSDQSWSQFLIDIGVLNREAFEAKNNDFYDQYKAGTLDIYEFLDFQLKPLADHPRTQLDAWHQQFMQKVIKPNLKPQAKQLVQKHQQAGDDCVVITATNQFITTPIVKAFGISHLLATQAEVIEGEFTGKPTGVPCFQEGKVKRLQEWLAGRGRSIGSYSTVTFYSDSINDLPLLKQATHPVAVNPDPKLKQTALESGWPVLELFS